MESLELRPVTSTGVICLRLESLTHFLDLVSVLELTYSYIVSNYFTTEAPSCIQWLLSSSLS